MGLFAPCFFFLLFSFILRDFLWDIYASNNKRLDTCKRYVHNEPSQLKNSAEKKKLSSVPLINLCKSHIHLEMSQKCNMHIPCSFNALVWRWHLIWRRLQNAARCRFVQIWTLLSWCEYSWWRPEIWGFQNVHGKLLETWQRGDDLYYLLFWGDEALFCSYV